MTIDPPSPEVLDQRARELALPPSPLELDSDEVVVAIGRAVRVGVPLTELAGIFPLNTIARVPGVAVHILGLMPMMERRWLVADLDALLGRAPPRRRDRPGHALLLRRGPVALAVERAEATQRTPETLPAGDLHLVQGIAADGLMMLDAAAMLAAVVKGVP